MGYNSYNIDMFKEMYEGKDIVDYGKKQSIDFRKSVIKHENYALTLPTLFEYLKKHIYN